MRIRPLSRAMAFAAVLGATLAARAEPGLLTVRTVGVADGLASGGIRRIVRDSTGFLWFCTEGGLSRFDGSAFVSYGKDDGLFGPVVSDLVEDKVRATYWVATSEGLYRFAGDRLPSSGKTFTRVDLPIGGSVRRVLVDSRGGLWIASTDGLAVVAPGEDLAHARRLLPTPGSDTPTVVFALLEAADGAVWAGTQSDGLFRFGPGGIEPSHLPWRTGLSFIRDMLNGPDGRIWCTFFGGISRLREHPEAQSDPIEEIFDTNDGVPSGDTSALLNTPDGEIIAGTTAGVARLRNDAQGTWKVAGSWTKREGLTSDAVQSLAFDPAGSLWIGTVARGAMKLVPGGFQRYPELEESSSILVGVTTDAKDGVLVLAAVAQSRYRLHRLTREGHSALDVRLPDGLTYLGWGGHRFLRSKDGGYWIATGEGLLRYEPHGAGGLERLRSLPDRRFGPAEGLPGRDIFWVKEDSRGTIWVAVSGPRPGVASLARLTRGAARFTTFPPTIGADPADLATGFAEDPAGTVWVVCDGPRIVRIDPNGHFAPVVFDPPLPAGSTVRLAAVASGRLWVLSNGAQVADEPKAETVRLRPGPPVLLGRPVYCAVEDAAGRTYFGTDRGVVRLDETHATTRLFTHADGLPGDTVFRCERDAQGNLWFGDPHGLVRLTPASEPDPPPLQARIGAILVDGAALPLPPLGAAAFGPAKLAPGPHRVSVQTFAIGYTPGERVLFQHRFEGKDDWSPASDARTLEFPRLTPGRHRLLIRAARENGAAAPPAVIDLSIPAPIWQRGWFVALTGTILLAAAMVAYRLRVARLLEIERMRTRIATDLHDAVGADLSRISLLADFVQQDVDERPARARTMLREVAQTARDAVREMSDIVWALQSKPADVSQVVGRVRDFAADLAGEAGIALHVSSTVEPGPVALGDERRRDLYLLLKEAVINAIRHAGAKTIDLTITHEGGGIVCELSDDGRGFDPEAPPSSRGGHGLPNMRARAVRLGGTLTIESAPGGGTTVRLTVRGA